MYKLSISLRGCPHPCTRELIIDDSLSLNELSWAINLAFGWNCSHLNEFEIEGKALYCNYTEGESYTDLPFYNTEDFTVQEAFEGVERLSYSYDFGDGWMHDIELKRVKSKGNKIQLKSGIGNCPPDDCGGMYGYEEMLKELKKPRSEEAMEWRVWLDGRPLHPTPWRKPAFEATLNRMNYFLDAGIPINDMTTPIFAAWLEFLDY